ncbi:MAG: type IX secretion system sortase PorU [Bacteroides sp.]|nr:type IX secretion system sortase PorU [Bacteroides sp.]
MKHFLALFISLIFCIGTIQAQTYPEPSMRKSYSVLAAGQTLKVAVTQDAVYRIGYEDLVRQGFISQSIASEKIALYGNAAGMLPFFNIAGIYDDLSPLPVDMHDGGDGSFGPGDYFLFYGQSPHRWVYNIQNQEFAFVRHHFCDTSFYFVSLNAEWEHRVSTASPTTSSGNRITWFNEHIHHENDWTNLCSGGLDWFGESFTFSGNSRSINLATPDPVSGQNGILYAATGAQSVDGTASFQIRLNQTTLNLYHSGGADYSAAATKGNVQVVSGTSTANISFSKTGSTNNGYLDYLSLVYPRQLRLNGTALFFRHTQAILEEVLFSIEAAANTLIWDVSDVYHITAISPHLSNGRLEFGTEPDNTLHEYVAFSIDRCPSPDFKEIIPGQNLHQLQNIDYVVVTHPLFLEQAREVARLHRERDGYTTCVATTEQVYNEFSSGSKDPSAIRMFLRHLYIRSDSTHKPLYLLLFGAASYDYKNIMGSRTDFVPTMQTTSKSAEQNDPLEDAFGYLADGAGMNPNGISSIGRLQVAIGRLPVHTEQEANDVLEKIDIYSNPHYLSDPTQPDLSGNFGNWRNEIVFVTDDDFEQSMENEIIQGNYIQKNLPSLHVNKLYSDNYERLSSSTTARIPALENAIKSFVEDGCLFLGYLGHSGWDAWSDEKIITNTLIDNWKKSFTYPVIFASSCTFAYFDQIEKLSGAERSVLKAHAGAIATIASTRQANTGDIEDIQKRFAETFISRTNGKINTIGEAFLYAKTTSTDRALYKFVLLGDPGLKAALPKNEVQTLHVNGKPADASGIDTLKALSPISIEGRIISRNGDPLNNFNGKLSVKFYDKPITKQTLGLYNARENAYNKVVSYTDQSSIIFQGETEVKDGYFSFSFIVPKDIQYNYGNGRISYYAYNDETDANGSFDGIVVGGMNPNAVIDTTAPVVDLYINKNTFSGGTVGAAPSLYAEISDEYGINTTGAGIGHDMTLVIDGDYKNSIVVNNQFRYSTGSYKSGTLTYPLELRPGKHTAQLKVWNINNISTTRTITFNVNASDKLKIFNFKVVPNPARDGYVDFYFNHNSKNGGIERCTLSIFSLQGARVAEFNYTINDLSGYTVGPLRWNLCGNGGKRVQAGVYVCYIKAVDAQGGTVHKDLKLIVVN